MIPRRRFLEWSGRLLLLTLSTALTLLLGELAIRLALPQQLILLRPDIWIPDDGLGFRMAPNLDTRVNTGEREIHLTTDADGFRSAPGPPPRPTRDRRSILVLGDSFLAALQVEHEQILTSLLARDPAIDARIVNTAVGGYDPNHYLLVARRVLARRDRQYDLVLVFLYRGNDVVSTRREHIPPQKSTPRQTLRWPRSLRRGELVDALLQPLNDGLETRSHLFMLVRNRAWHALMRLGLSARYFPSAELVSSAGDGRFELTGEICATIAAEAHAGGAASFFVLLPGIFHVDPAIGRRYATGVGLAPGDYDLEQSARLLTAELERRGLDHLDTTPALRAARARGIETHGRVDTHFSPAGHELVATELRPILRTLRARDEP